MPIGIFVDHHGPRLAVLGGAILMLLGYFPLHQAYQRASGSVMLLCVFSYMTGLGGCMAFSAAVKTSALNWPKHRGSATAFPLAAFGLSAFFFSFLGAVFFPGDPSAFLELLAWGTFGLTFGSFFFLKVHHKQTEYEAVPGSDDSQTIPSADSQQSRPGSSDEPKPYRSSRAEVEPGMLTNSSSNSTHTSTTSHVAGISSSSAAAPDPTGSHGFPFAPEFGLVVAPENPEDLEIGETSPLTSRPSSRVDQPLLGSHDINSDGSHHVDIRGLALVRSVSFWHLFVIMGILAGVGLMTIKYDCHLLIWGSTQLTMSPAISETMPRLFGNITIKMLPTILLFTDSKCMCRPCLSAVSWVDYQAVSQETKLNLVLAESKYPLRRRLRFLSQPTPC